MRAEPFVIAHRGASADAPENTLAAFGLGISQGADGVELDVHLTKDGKLAVIHDHRLDRTTTGTGLVKDKTMGELVSEDAGSWFSPAYAGIRIPELNEVLALLPAGYIVNIEIKNGPVFYPQIGRKLAEILQDWKGRHQYVISSFDHQVLTEVHTADPDLPLGLLYEAQLFNPAVYVNTLPYPVYSLHVFQHFATRAFVEAAHTVGLQVFTYTVDDKDDLARVYAAGVDGIICNHPQRARALLGLF